MGFTNNWSNASPIDHLKFKNYSAAIRDVKIDLEERLATILYGFTTGETFIGFKKGRFVWQGTAAPSAPPGTGLEIGYDLYSRKDGTGTPVELYGIDASGNECQLTKAGKIPYASLEATTLTTILQAVYPVGSIYVNKTVATNPATLLGFGTWAALEGRVLVGKASSGTFVAAGGTGGEETHVLTTPEMPAHVHSVTGGGASGGGSNYYVGNGGGYSMNTASTGGDGAHNNLQPYLIAYMWERLT